MKIKFNKKKINEFGWYIFATILGIFGIICIDIDIFKNEIIIKNNLLTKIHTFFSLKYFGFIFFVIAISIAIIVLIVNAEKNEYIINREKRYQYSNSNIDI